ncbi:MAG TPA: hypothetical protein VN766_06380 [Stellaceae bacterium]|jgi:hypothetical protein|nr:hypothetical protein [Stellaceae bacterium]
MRTRRHLLAVLAVALALTGGAAGAQAQHRAPPDFHGRDFRHLGPHERTIWRGGVWFHGWHDGRYAWWWRLGPSWYFYPEPIYPYPSYIPPAIIVQQPPPQPSGLPPAQSWYYCENPQGYYPYVASCNGPWRAVPTTPPAASGQ